MGEAPEYRTAKRNCNCRVCNKDMIQRVDTGVFWRSFNFKDRIIVICDDCVRELYKLLPEEGENG